MRTATADPERGARFIFSRNICMWSRRAGVASASQRCASFASTRRSWRLVLHQPTRLRAHRRKACASQRAQHVLLTKSSRALRRFLGSCGSVTHASVLRSSSGSRTIHASQNRQYPNRRSMLTAQRSGLDVRIKWDDFFQLGSETACLIEWAYIGKVLRHQNIVSQYALFLVTKPKLCKLTRS